MVAVVWPEQKQVKLLDSIYRNFYVPPIVFAVSRDRNGELTRMCVDGKQRLTSIQKFMDGQVRIFFHLVPFRVRILGFPCFLPKFRLFEHI